MHTAEFDTSVRLHIYHHLLATGTAPAIHAVAQALDTGIADVEAAYRRLAADHLIVLTPGTLDIRMAHPFSAVPTPFRVETPRGTCWGNCIWDALGIAAAVHSNARISTTCPDCEAPLHVNIAVGALEQAAGTIHFAVPAAHWWDDIVFT